LSQLSAMEALVLALNAFVSYIANLSFPYNKKLCYNKAVLWSHLNNVHCYNLDQALLEKIATINRSVIELRQANLYTPQVSATHALLPFQDETKAVIAKLEFLKTEIDGLHEKQKRTVEADANPEQKRQRPDEADANPEQKRQRPDEADAKAAQKRTVEADANAEQKRTVEADAKAAQKRTVEADANAKHKRQRTGREKTKQKRQLEADTQALSDATVDKLVGEQRLPNNTERLGIMTLSQIVKIIEFVEGVNSKPSETLSERHIHLMQLLGQSYKVEIIAWRINLPPKMLIKLLNELNESYPCRPSGQCVQLRKLLLILQAVLKLEYANPMEKHERLNGLEKLFDMQSCVGSFESRVRALRDYIARNWRARQVAAYYLEKQTYPKSVFPEPDESTLAAAFEKLPIVSKQNVLNAIQSSNAEGDCTENELHKLHRADWVGQVMYLVAQASEDKH
jgi:hypothetical protein